MTYYLLHPAAVIVPTCPNWRQQHRMIPGGVSSSTPIVRHRYHGGLRSGKGVVVGGKSIIRSMANPRRVKMVAKQIRRELSDMLLTDNVLQFAVLPEASLGADRYLSSLTTITDVQVSADLQVFSFS